MLPPEHKHRPLRPTWSLRRCVVRYPGTEVWKELDTPIYFVPIMRIEAPGASKTLTLLFKGTQESGLQLLNTV